jgi:hypothetical protein
MVVKTAVQSGKTNSKIFKFLVYLDWISDPARISTFTLNGKPDTLIVLQSNDSHVTFLCQSGGRPSPTLTLHKVGNETALSSVVGGELSHVMRSARCEDTGSYRCEAANGVRNRTHLREVTLNVVCKLINSILKINFHQLSEIYFGT